MFESNTYDLTRISYGRRGTFYYLSVFEEDGASRLWVCAVLSGLDTAGPGQTPRLGRLFPVRLMRGGQELAYTASATPVCVTLSYDGGKARLALQQGSILRMEAENAEVVFAPKLAPHEIAKTRNDGSWEVIMNPLPKLLFCPVKGEMEAVTGFDVIHSIPADTSFTFRPDESGKVDLAVHMYKSNGWRMETYPAFSDVISDIEAEFSAYLETVPALSAEFADARVLNAYIIWSHIMSIDGEDIIYMNKGVHRCTSSWQQCYHAMGQYKNPRFALELMLSVFRYQDEFGMLPDLLTDASQSFGGTKPPFYGVALEFLQEFTDFSFASRAQLLKLYEGLSKWVYWWMSYRDTDNDGIVQYDTADESGWDDSSFFKMGGPTAAPDLATYLILAMEHLAKLAKRLGKTYEMRQWQKAADEMLEKTLTFFWNGETFTSRVSGTLEWVDCGTIMAFIPLLLGKKRLPKEYIEKMTAALSREGDWLTPFGLAGEKLSSDHYHETGWSAGPILAPAQLLVVLGLRACGEDKLARDIALRYCRALVRANFPMVINPKTGRDVSEGRWGERYPNRMAWTAVVFLILGSLYSVGENPEIGYSVKQIDEHTWQIEEHNHRLGVFCYLLEGEKKAMLVDSALGNIDLGGIVRGLTDKPVAVINTHSHGDHIGGNADFTEIYISKDDQEGYARDAAGKGPGKLPRPVPLETIGVEEGQEFDLGGRTLRVVATPGHSDGSISILDVERRLLFTGDCCCRGEILAFSRKYGLAGYRDTMKKILDLGDKFDTTWPAHCDTPVGKDVLKRIYDLAEDILAGKLEEKEFPNKFFGEYKCAYRDELGIVYPPVER